MIPTSTTDTATIEPLGVSIKQACLLTGLSKSKIEEELRAGVLEAKKDGRRTTITYQSIKRRHEGLPTATFLPPRKRGRAMSEYKPVRGWPAPDQLSPEKKAELTRLQQRPEIVALQAKYEAALPDKIFLQLDERFALGADDLQWILYSWRRPVSYVRSTKGILFRVLREAGCKPYAEAQKALEALPSTFDEWKAASGGLESRAVEQPTEIPRIRKA